MLKMKHWALGLAVAVATMFSVAVMSDAMAQTAQPAPAAKTPAPAAKAPAAKAAAPTCTPDQYYNKVTKACAPRCQAAQGLKWGSKGVNAKTKAEIMGCVSVCAATEKWDAKTKACVAKPAPAAKAPPKK